MDQYGAPKQFTPSGGLHYLFVVDTERAKSIPNARTGITYNDVKCAMDVKFKNQLMNCAPSNIDGYGRHNPGHPEVA
jgi:hypothetical protein